MSEPSTSSPDTTWRRVAAGWYRRQHSPQLWVHVQRVGSFWTIRASESADEVDTSRAGGAYPSRRYAVREADQLYPRQGQP